MKYKKIKKKTNKKKLTRFFGYNIIGLPIWASSLNEALEYEPIKEIIELKEVRRHKIKWNHVES